MDIIFAAFVPHVPEAFISARVFRKSISAAFVAPNCNKALTSVQADITFSSIVRSYKLQKRQLERQHFPAVLRALAANLRISTADVAAQILSVASKQNAEHYEGTDSNSLLDVGFVQHFDELYHSEEVQSVVSNLITVMRSVWQIFGGNRKQFLSLIHQLQDKGTLPVFPVSILCDVLDSSEDVQDSGESIRRVSLSAFAKCITFASLSSTPNVASCSAELVTEKLRAVVAEIRPLAKAETRNRTADTASFVSSTSTTLSSERSGSPALLLTAEATCAPTSSIPDLAAGTADDPVTRALIPIAQIPTSATTTSNCQASATSATSTARPTKHRQPVYNSKAASRSTCRELDITPVQSQLSIATTHSRESISMTCRESAELLAAVRELRMLRELMKSGSRCDGLDQNGTSTSVICTTRRARVGRFLSKAARASMFAFAILLGIVGCILATDRYYGLETPPPSSSPYDVRV
jgi:hypothetical protein